MALHPLAFSITAPCQLLTPRICLGHLQGAERMELRAEVIRVLPDHLPGQPELRARPVLTWAPRWAVPRCPSYSHTQARWKPPCPCLLPRKPQNRKEEDVLKGHLV